MEGSSKNWLTVDAPTGWTALIVRTVTVAVIAFVVLQAKEWLDAGRFDLPGVAADAGLVAAGVLVFNAILIWSRRS
jgi:hypothetical protein